MSAKKEVKKIGDDPIITAFEARFPNFSTEQVESVLPRLIPGYTAYYNAEFGVSSDFDNSILFLLAHLFVIETSPSPAQINQLSSSSVQGVSQNFNVEQNTSAFRSFFNSTWYGQQFLMSINPRQGAMFV